MQLGNRQQLRRTHTCTSAPPSSAWRRIRRSPSGCPPPCACRPRSWPQTEAGAGGGGRRGGGQRRKECGPAARRARMHTQHAHAHAAPDLHPTVSIPHAAHAGRRKARDELTLGPQSRVQPSLMGISTTSTLGASVKYERASSASCTAEERRAGGSGGWAPGAGKRAPQGRRLGGGGERDAAGEERMCRCVSGAGAGTAAFCVKQPLSLAPHAPRRARRSS